MALSTFLPMHSPGWAGKELSATNPIAPDWRGRTKRPNEPNSSLSSASEDTQPKIASAQLTFPAALGLGQGCPDTVGGHPGYPATLLGGYGWLPAVGNGGGYDILTGRNPDHVTDGIPEHERHRSWTPMLGISPRLVRLVGLIKD